MPTSTEPTVEERIAAAVSLAQKETRYARDEYWRGEIGKLKVIVRQAVTMHAPMEHDRDPRWTRFINALYAGVVRVAGPM